MDTPARADMKMIKHPTGANACPYCNGVGVYLGRICFPLQISEPRTDDSFRNRKDILHHNSRPDERGPLEHLNIDMIKNFPPDYLHVVCIGVVKKLEMLTKKLKFPKNIDQRQMFEQTSIENINQAIVHCRMTQLAEVHRALRSLSHVSRFKGTEFRAFILYYGIVIFKDNVDA